MRVDVMRCLLLTLGDIWGKGLNADSSAAISTSLT